ncbi:alkyl hydroperoxide reductase [Bacillus salacetis]|uniref:Alkyl hydroperoxide reductase n=2 Tax=Bacillus salacetis TaxID=2315464 RepID=A0A3A1R5M2_9BACI|nr:alkyl hydroperoxide reductase [Bacillus salacetis]
MDYSGKHPIQEPFCAQPNGPAPSFSAEAFFNTDKKIKTISLNDFRGKWVVLFFYGSDFTFV